MCGNLDGDIDRGMAAARMGRKHGQCPNCHHYGSDCHCHEASPQREAGFNYGQPLPFDPRNPVIADGEALSARLRIAAQKASAAAWEMEMACRAYRIAETVAQREAATIRLINLYAEHKAPATISMPSTRRRPRS